MRSYCRVQRRQGKGSVQSSFRVRSRRHVAWRKAGRSLKGFGFVPEVTACVLTVGFRVGKVGLPFIHRLGLVPKRYCINFVGNGKCTKTTCFFNDFKGKPVVPFRDLGSFQK